MLLLLLAGCSRPLPPLVDGFEEALGPTGWGCGEATIWLYKRALYEGDELLLQLRLRDVVDPDVVEAQTDTSTLPIDGRWGQVWVTRGFNLADAACDDAVDGTTEVRETWTGISGTVDLTVRTTTSDTLVFRHADATLEDLVVERDGDTVQAGDIVFTDIDVGWLPG